MLQELLTGTEPAANTQHTLDYSQAHHGVDVLFRLSEKINTLVKHRDIFLHRGTLSSVFLKAVTYYCTVLFIFKDKLISTALDIHGSVLLGDPKCRKDNLKKKKKSTSLEIIFWLFFALQPGGDAVSLLENVALISQGTTGLVTWEAALYLAEWALDHRQAFTDRYPTSKTTMRRTPFFYETAGQSQFPPTDA